LHLKRWIAASGISLLLLIAGTMFFSRQILWEMGALLVAAETPQKSDIELVLGGDATGSRILKACELLEGGYAHRVMVSGEGSYYGTHESVLAINLAVSQGCPREDFLPFKFPATNTVEEAEHVIPELRKLGVHKLLIVTSPSHTARAGRAFRRLAPDLEIHTVASSDRRWNGGYWWKTREGRKAWLLESVKTVADFIGL
jgi:uncharacterized SAM-binding protein YcdF (DUF218 family)